MTGRAPTDGRMDACLAVLDEGGSTSTEVAARVWGQPSYAAIARAHGALLRLQKTGLVRSERSPVRVIWFPVDRGEQSDVADPGRVAYGAGMMRYGN
jgi:hypothetical protein